MIAASTVETCGRCRGEGIVSSLPDRAFGHGENEPSICPKCKGSGNRTVVNIVPRRPNFPGAAFAPLAKCEPTKYPPPKTDHADVRGVLVNGTRRYVLEVVRGARMVEAQITRAELQQLRDAADVLLGMENE